MSFRERASRFCSLFLSRSPLHPIHPPTHFPSLPPAPFAVYVYTFIYTRCTYSPAKKRYTRPPSIHVSLLTPIPSAIHTTLSPTKRIRATINMGVGTSGEDEEKEEVDEENEEAKVAVVVECRRSCGYTVDI